MVRAIKPNQAGLAWGGMGWANPLNIINIIIIIVRDNAGLIKCRISWIRIIFFVARIMLLSWVNIGADELVIFWVSVLSQLILPWALKHR